MLTLDILKNAVDCLNEDVEKPYFLIIPSKDFDDPEIKRLYEIAFPGVELRRNEPINSFFPTGEEPQH